MANSDYGAIPLTIAEATSEALNTKLDVSTGFKPSEWATAIASIPSAPALTSNLWGGLQMAVDMSKNVPYPNGMYLQDRKFIINGPNIGGTPVMLDNSRFSFKANTQYTLICAISHSSIYDNTVFSNAQIHYTDGTTTSIEYKNNDDPPTANTKYTFAIVSDANKTIDYIYASYQWYEAIWYLDECGLFEGVKTVADFEPYNRYNT